MASIGVIILSTFPSEELAVEVANYVVSAKLCACVNFTQDPVNLLLEWTSRGSARIHCSFQNHFKICKKLKAEIARLHPYEVPR